MIYWNSEQIFAEAVGDGNIRGILQLGRRNNWVISRSQVRLEEGAFSSAAGDGKPALARGWLRGSEVAVKLAAGESWTAVINELRLLQNLHHEYVVFFHGAMKGPERGSLCVLTEWVQGCDLRQYVLQRAQNGEFEQQVRKLQTATGESQLTVHEHRLLTDVARGLQFAHSQRPAILHLDVEPANVLVETATKPPRAKVANFGMGELLRRGASVQRVPQWQSASGRAFAAPELAAGGPFGAGADVFSFGRLAQFVLYAAEPDPELVRVASPAAEATGGAASAFEAALGPAAAPALRLEGLAVVRPVAVACLAREPTARPGFTAVCRALTAAAASAAAAEVDMAI